MLKSTLVVIVYSLVLIALFSTFCYLMTTVNPVPIKQDPGRARKFGSDDFLYPNDVIIPHDNVAFGLEKIQEYDTVESERSNKISSLKYTPEIPRTIGKYVGTGMCNDKNKMTNCTRNQEVNFIKMLTKPMKVPLKGYRRSIGHDDQRNIYFNTPESLLLKINNVDETARIEIKILTDQLEDNKIEFIINNTKINFGNQNSSIIKLEGTDTLMVKILEDSTECNAQNNDKCTERHQHNNKTINKEERLSKGVIDNTENANVRNFYKMFSGMQNNFTTENIKKIRKPISETSERFNLRFEEFNNDKSDIKTISNSGSLNNANVIEKLFKIKNGTSILSNAIPNLLKPESSTIPMQ